jgi:hypothetical protein
MVIDSCSAREQATTLLETERIRFKGYGYLGRQLNNIGHSLLYKKVLLLAQIRNLLRITSSYFSITHCHDYVASFDNISTAARHRRFDFAMHCADLLRA